jgi:hypothetical protein
MSPKISLRELEQRSFNVTFQDGLLDIFLGSVILMFVIAPFLSPYLGDFWSSAVFLPFWALIFVLLWAIKKHVVHPRVGIVEYGSWRRSRMMRFNILMLVAGIFALLLGVLSAVRFEAVPGWMHTARFSLLILIGFSVTGFFLGIVRLYVYGLMIALAPLAGELLYHYLGVPHHGYPVTFGITAVTVLCTGLVLLIRLIDRYPLEEGGLILDEGRHEEFE